MRMAANQLLRNSIEGIIDAKFSVFRRHFGEEDGLQHEIAEFFSQARPILLIDGVENLVGLLEKIRFNGVEVLLAIPGAAAGGAQASHDGDQSLEAFASCGWMLRHAYELGLAHANGGNLRIAGQVAATLKVAAWDQGSGEPAV